MRVRNCTSLFDPIFPGIARTRCICPLCAGSSKARKRKNTRIAVRPKVVGGRTGVTFGIQMIEERDNQLRIEIFQSKGRRKFAGSTMRELQEELESIAVGGNSMWAYVALVGEPMSEEAFDEPRERIGHSDTPHLASRRILASFSRSGCAVRYQ